MTRAQFFKVLVAMHGMQWIGIFSLLLLVGIILSIFVDWQIIIVTLMVVFVVVPIVMMFLYFFHALKPLTLLNTSPHRFEKRENGLTVVMTETGREVNLEYGQLQLYSDFDKGLIYTTPTSGWIWISEIFFDDEEKFLHFINDLREQTK